jgi:hypothetical protein
MLDNYGQIIILAVLGLLLAWNIILQVSLFRLKKNQKIMFSGKSGKDLEKIILEIRGKINSLDGDVKDLYDITGKIHHLALKGVHKVGVVRFNPFRDIGGDQSFSVALLDADDSGVVFSSLYSRDGVRVYAKSILNRESGKYPLTQEEQEAIKIASLGKEKTEPKKIRF